MTKNLFPQNQMVAPIFALKTQYQKVLKSLLTAFLLLLSVFGWGQQVIGSFPNQDGGIEGQTVGALTTTSSTTSWWLSTSITGSIVSGSARTGDKSANITMSGATHRTLRGPANSTIAAATNYTIQFFYKGDKNADGTADYGDIRGGVNGSAFQYGAYLTNQNQTGWTKYTATTSTAPGATTTGHAVVSIVEVAGKTADFDIDDVVMYAGAADNTAPNSPGAVTVANATVNSLDVSWAAASSGVDGGGYVVVRYATNPNADNDPNQNGIYAVGNTTTNGTGSLTGTVVYTGTGLSFTDGSLASGTTYYYKVYTVDKAFNYSTESTGSGSTTTAGFTVTYNGNTNTGGAVPTDSNSPYASGSTVTVLGNTGTLAKTNYNFTGWNTLATGLGTNQAVGSTFTIAANTTLFAKWTGNVTYNANGGTGTTTDATDYAPGASVATAANGFSYTGFTFAGWNTQADGLGTNYTASQANAFNFSGNITLYAKWTSTSTITYANFQFPTSNTINEGDTYTVYGRVYANGITNSPGQGAGISAWVGYSSTSSDPSTAGWTWVSLSYLGDDGPNNDEYSGLLGSGITPGTYNVVTRFQIGSGAYVYGGKNNAIWLSAADNGSLTVNSNTVGYANIQSPFTGNILQGSAFNVYARVYKTGYTEAGGSNSNITSWIGYSTTNAATTSDFSTGWTWVPASFNVQVGNDDEYVANIGTSLPAGTYYYVSRFQVAGSTEYRYGGTNNNFWGAPANSGVLTVQSPREINVKQLATNIASGGTYNFANQTSGTSSSVITFTVENTGDQPLDVSAITVSGTNASEFGVVSSAPLTVNNGTPTTFTVTFSPTSMGAKSAKITISNNDADESVYEINLTGTGTNNASTDIAVASGFTHPTNILYANYQAINIDGTTGGDIEIARFAIRDGGTGGDLDNLATTINSLSFNLTNSTNVRKVALYDGTTEIGEQAASTSHTFSGLNLIAPDNGTKEFSIRVSFKNVVTDNQQVQVAITSATAAATGSGLTAFLGANSSIAGDNNRIEVTADRLAFAAQPPASTNVNVAMAGSVTVSANDANANRDLDFTGVAGTVNITSTGTLSGTPVSVNAANGLATFAGNLTHTAQGTGLSLNASSTGLVGATSTNFNITLVSAATDRFRTIGSGNWSSANTWESSSDGISWVNPSTLAPTSSAFNIEILNTHTVTTAGSATAKNLTVKTGGKLQLNFAVTNTGTFNIEDAGTVVINFSTPTPAGNVWAGTENFAGESIFIVNKWDRTTELFSNSTDITTNLSTGAKFGFLDINLGTAGINGNWTFVLPGGSFKLTNKNFLITNSTSNNVTLNPDTVEIGGDFIVSGTGNIVSQSQAGNKTIIVDGNFIKNGSGEYRSTNSGTSYVSTLNVDGDFIVNAGSFSLDIGITGLSTSIVNLKGNLSKAAGSYMTNSNTNSITNAFNFIGSTIQTVNLNVEPTADMLRYKFFVKAGAYVLPITQNWKLSTDSKITVESGGTLDFGFDGLNGTGTNALNLVRVSGQTGQTFTAATGSTLKISSPEGLVAGSTTLAADLYKGNVQIGASAAARVFDPGATYHYTGKSATAQVTGNGLPNVTGKVIVDMENASGQFAASSSKTITSPGTLEIRTGVVTDDSTNGFIGSGNLTMNSANGRYITSKTGPQPALTGTYALTNGVVEFANTSSSASIRVTPQYYNVDVSGTNIIVGGKDFIVNNLLKVTSATAVLTVPSETDNLDAYVVTAKKGIQVVTNGKVIFKNNAQLMQDSDAVNSGSISMEREATIPVSTFNQYAYWSSPVIGQDFKNIFPGNPTSALYHNESNNKFYTSTGAYIPGRGLAVRNPFIASGTADIKTASLSGTPYNADLSYNLNFTDAQHGYNLVGNPYPSNLNLNQLYLNSSNIASTFLFWDNTSNTEQTQLGNSYTGDSYAKFNALAGDTGTGIPAPGKGAPASNNSKTPNNILKVGQGFMVRAKSSGAAVAFRNTDRITTQTSAQFFGKGGKELVNNRYVVEFVTPRSLVFSNAVVYFENGNNNYAVDDSKLESAVSEGLFTQAEDEKVVINGRSSFVNTDLVKVGTRQFTSGLYSIRLGTKEGIFANGQNIYLKDKQTGIVTNLSAGNYTFQANSGESTGRFEIIYQPETVLATDTKVKENLIVYKDGNDFVVKAQNKKISSLEVFDSAGRLILALKPESIKAIIPAEKINNGLYVLKINQNGEITSKKIIR